MNVTATKPLNIEDLKRLRRMGRKMLSAYEVLDPAAAKAAAGLTVSCKAGCAGCCYQMVLLTLPEAVAIAEHFLSDAQRRQLIPLLMRSFWEQLQSLEGGETVKEMRQKYFAKGQPCVFLSTETKLCTIYDVRPGACRYHSVVSEPALCQPEAGLQNIAMVNTHEVQREVLSEANKVSNQTKIPLFVAPMPVAMLWAFKLLIEGREAFDEALKDPNLGTMDLKRWQARVIQPEAAGAAP